MQDGFRLTDTSYRCLEDGRRTDAIMSRQARRPEDPGPPNFGPRAMLGRKRFAPNPHPRPGFGTAPSDSRQRERLRTNRQRVEHDPTGAEWIRPPSPSHSPRSLIDPLNTRSRTPVDPSKTITNALPSSGWVVADRDDPGANGLVPLPRNLLGPGRSRDLGHRDRTRMTLATSRMPYGGKTSRSCGRAETKARPRLWTRTATDRPVGCASEGSHEEEPPPGRKLGGTSQREPQDVQRRHRARSRRESSRGATGSDLIGRRLLPASRDSGVRDGV